MSGFDDAVSMIYNREITGAGRNYLLCWQDVSFVAMISCMLIIYMKDSSFSKDHTVFASFVVLNILALLSVFPLPIFLADKVSIYWITLALSSLLVNLFRMFCALVRYILG